MYNDIYKFFCCTHVKTKTIDDRLYESLHTGCDWDGYKIPETLGDNTGDNISYLKYKYDGYLTGMYWIWKNTNYKCVGLCGYRAYMGKDNKTPLKLEDVQNIFEKENVDFVVARLDLKSTVEQQFRTVHKDFYFRYLHDPLQYIQEVISQYFPEYKDAFQMSLSGNIINYRHTFIAKKEYFDKYCEWLFSVLKKYDIYLETRKYPIPPRFFGYIAERLERAWLLKQRIKVKELPIVYVSERELGL